MNYLRLIKYSAAALLVVAAFFFGHQTGKNSEELKNARIEISTLKEAIEEYKTRRQNDESILSSLRIAESRSRDELDGMRKQLGELERKAKTNVDRERNRCLRLATEGKELLERAERAIEFCRQNHK